MTRRADAERIARLYEGFYADQEPFSGPMPRCVVEPIAEGPADYVSPLRFAAGVTMLVIVTFVFGWVL
jgi:hypothetical protein